MASSKEYVYQIRGNQLSLVEKDFTTSDGLNYTYTSGSGLDIPSGSTILKSPLSAVADGIELEYAYSPNYFITQTNITHTTITGYRSNGGYLQIKGGSVNYDTTLDVDDFIVLKNAGTLNGLHKITAIENVDATKDGITLNTKYSGSTAWSTFEKTVTLYYRVDALVDESSPIDLPSYLSKALVYYVKAKVAEDAMNIEAKEYLMREFRKMLEKHESSKISGPRKVMTGSHAIR